MKIHRTKKGCAGKELNHQLRTASADKTAENQGPVENHSAEEIQATDSDTELLQLLKSKRQRVNFPPASEI